jgi:hypothetical protein
MKVQLITPYCVSHLQRYDITVRGYVTSVYTPTTVERRYRLLSKGSFCTASDLKEQSRQGHGDLVEIFVKSTACLSVSSSITALIAILK